jgi:hypothetical protein
VEQHQIRLTKKGWQKRIVQSNGPYIAIGKPEFVDEQTGFESWVESHEYE